MRIRMMPIVMGVLLAAVMMLLYITAQKIASQP